MQKLEGTAMTELVEVGRLNRADVFMDKDDKPSAKLTRLFGTEDMLRNFRQHSSPFAASPGHKFSFQRELDSLG